MKVSEFEAKKKFSEASGSCAVVDSNITMELNEYGVYEEKVLVNGDYNIDSLVEYVSPFLNEVVNVSDVAMKLYGDKDGINFDKRLGYYMSLYVGHVDESNYREKASSGGMGTWILKELFENHFIDGVIHVKENPDKSSPILFQYDISRSIEEIRAGAKTKYYPVEFSRVLKIVKEVPGRYAFIGIPSFVMAIRLLAEKDEIIRDRIKYTVGLICGHQKSSKFAEAMAWQVGIKPGNLQQIDFRKKIFDRPANNYAVEMVGIINGEQVTIVKPADELLGQDWGQGFFKTLASDFTDDVMNETSDITIGDAWLTEYIKDSKGNNVVIVRNALIDSIINKGLETGKLCLNEVDKETIFISQLSHYRHTHDELAYRLHKKDKFKEWRPQQRIEVSNNISILRRKIQDLREEISKQSHLLYKKAIELDDLNYFTNEMDKLSKKYIQLYKMMYLQKIGISEILKLVIRKFLKIRHDRKREFHHR